MRFAKAFLAGLAMPSSLSVAIMVATCSLCFLASVLYLPVIFSKPVSKLFVSATDHYYYVTRELFDLKEQPTGEKPVFVIAGASVTQSSFGGTGKVSEALQEKFGKAFDVRLMTTGRQNLVEHFMIFDHLPQDRPVLAVLGVGPARFSWEKDQYLRTYDTHRFGTSSPAYLAQLARLDPDFEQPSGHLLRDHLAFYVARTEDILTKLARAALGKAGGREQNQYVGRRQSDAGYRGHAARVAGRLAGAENHSPLNHDLFRDLLAFVKQRGNIELVVMEHPIRPGFVEDFYNAEAYARHLAKMAQITREAGIRYVIADQETALGEDDFYDWAHIRTRSAQNQLRAAMLRAFSGSDL